MDLLPDVHTNENRLQGSLTEGCCNNVSGRTEVFNSLDEGHTFSDVQQSKHGHSGNLLAFRMSELTKLGSLESISMRTLFSVVSRGFDESIQKTNQDIPQHAASALKLVVQEIEQRVSKQAKDTRKQSNLYKSREDGYKSRVRALETLASGTIEENEVVKKILEQLKIAKNKIEEKKKLEEQDLIILRKEKHICEGEILSLKEELMSTQKAFDESRFQLEAEAKETKGKLQKKILELEYLLADSRKKVRDIEDYSESKFLQWKRKECGYRHFIDSQFRSLQELRSTSESVKQEVVKIKNIHATEFHCFGANLRGLIDAAENYNKVLEENRKLYNQVQDLKGNIRVYCRIRPFLPGQSEKQTTIQYIGENGELVVVNPLKPGKDSHRVFKFNKVFGPSSTQEEVFHDTQPLIRSVLDGYSVCIFAYGQTGSGKTYTMSGPNVMSVVDWGVNYRALNDLFNISQQRHSAIAYEISVQMVEIYNEQVRDLLCNDSSRKRLGIWNTAQPNGLAVPDASIHAVKSTTDVLELMNIGLMNRAVGATALNERSSRSHSILTVHVRGLDMETNAILRGCLHLVDLAGSERVERSESLGDRLREAQNINKSLSALGDVIFALAQKSPHVPFRNSKLTQVLQTSLGGQAKTLMFVQLNPDVKSYSETVSTLKFAERVSGVELGAAQSNKEGRSVRELMEQVSSLKDLVTKKDEEMRQLRLLRTVGIGENSGSLPRRGSESPTRHFTWEAQPGQILSGKKISIEKAVSDLDNSSEHSDKHSETGLQFMDEFKQHKGFFQHSRRAVTGGGENFPDEIGSKRDSTNGGRNSNANFELSGFEDADSEEKLSDESSGVLSVERETDASIDSFLDNTRFSETGKQTSETIGKLKGPYKPPMPQTQQGQAEPSQFSLNKSSSKFPSSKRATTSIFPPLSLPKDGSSKSQVTSTLTTKKKNFH